MRRLVLPILLVVLVGIFVTGCDVNIFSRFEDIPIYSDTDLQASLDGVNIDPTTGTITATDPAADPDFLVIVEDDPDGEGGDPPDSVEVNPSLRAYVELIEQMADNDTLDDFEAEGGDLGAVAENLETILDAILDELDIELPGEGGSEGSEEPAGSRSFSEIIHEIYGDDVTQGDIDSMREVIQNAAAAAIEVRLEHDDNARALVEDTADLLIQIFGAMDVFSSRELATERSLDIPVTGGGTQTYENLSDRIQLVLEGTDVAGDPLTYVLVITGLDTPEDELDDSAYFQVVDPLTDDGLPFVLDLSGMDYPEGGVDLDEEIIPGEGTEPGYTVGELFTFVDTYLGAGVDSISNAQELVSVTFDEFSAFLPTLAEIEIESAALEDVFDVLSDTFNVEKFDQTIATFDSIADASRSFAVSLDVTKDLEGNITGVTGISDRFLKADGSLNGDGVNMVIMSTISLVMDYAFKVDDTDGIGVIYLPAAMGFIRSEDAISIEMVGTGTEDEFMRVTLKYLADMIPGEFDPDIDGDSTGDFPVGLQQTLLTGGETYLDESMDDFLKGYAQYAGILDEDGQPSNPEEDLIMLQKMISILDLLDDTGSVWTDIQGALDDLSGGA